MATEGIGDGNRRAVQVRHGAPQLIKDVGNCISCNRSGGGGGGGSMIVVFVCVCVSVFVSVSVFTSMADRYRAFKI